MSKPLYPLPESTRGYRDRLVFITSVDGVDIRAEPEDRGDMLPYLLVYNEGCSTEWYACSNEEPVIGLPLGHPAVVFTTNLVALSQ